MRPYVSSRAGNTQWLLQRVSAVLLIVLAFVHFGMQHFTSDAVSTGLTVAARMDNRLWQAYYVVFIAMALYHGINGLVGIIADYCPRQLWRNILTVGCWSIGVYFVTVAVLNIASAPRLGVVKEWYAQQGFAAGASAGNPPALSVEYDFREPMRELHLLAHYLEHHTHNPPEDLAAVFGNCGEVAENDRHAVDLVKAGGRAFEAWARAQQPVSVEERDRQQIFSSRYEFAIWALNVRQANAAARSEPTGTLHAISSYSAQLH